MADLWGKVQDTINEARPYVEDAFKKAQDLTKQGAKYAEIKAVDWKISNKFSQLGGKAYDAIKAGTIDDDLKSEEIVGLIEEIKKLEEERATKEKELEDMKKA